MMKFIVTLFTTRFRFALKYATPLLGKKKQLLLPLLLLGGVLCTPIMAKPFFKKPESETDQTVVEKDSVLRHVVLFKFKPGTTADELEKIATAFGELPSKIKEIKDFEWGPNNSPEGLDKGFTHCFFVTFESEGGRAVYLPHPDHKAFVELASPYIADVLVFDYWSP